MLFVYYEEDAFFYFTSSCMNASHSSRLSLHRHGLAGLHIESTSFTAVTRAGLPAGMMMDMRLLYASSRFLLSTAHLMHLHTGAKAHSQREQRGQSYGTRSNRQVLRKFTKAVL